MKISKITIDNFRSFEHLEVIFGKRLTLLIGENGSGKTTVLDALSIVLGAVLTYLPRVSGISFKKTDLRQIKNKFSPYTRGRVESFDGLVWDRTERRDKSAITSSQLTPGAGLYNLRKYLNDQIIHPMLEEEEFQLPVFSYYGVGRALVDVPLRRRGFPKSHQRLEAFENALNSVSRFKSAFVWFYNKEFEEQKRQKELQSFGYKLPELEAVRTAIKSLFPDIEEPHIMLNPLRFAVKINNEVLDITQLSDGYKTLLSLVIDLSARMALANPHMEDPLQAEAVVLIDELDLHLHPEWQKRIINDLLRTFPNSQFIFTTQSPYIVESLNNHLMRHHISGIPIEDKNIKNIIPIPPDDLKAYHLEDHKCISVLDPELNLIDDKLIRPYNNIAAEYEKMRDLQWEHTADD